MQQKVRRFAVIAAGLLAASFIGTGTAAASSGSPAPKQHDCTSSIQLNAALASCQSTYPGTIQVVIECTNTIGTPYPVTKYGPAVPAEAHNTSYAACGDDEKVTNHFAAYNP